MYSARLTLLVKHKDTKDHAKLSIKCSWLDSTFAKSLSGYYIISKGIILIIISLPLD